MVKQQRDGRVDTPGGESNVGRGRRSAAMGLTLSLLVAACGVGAGSDAADRSPSAPGASTESGRSDESGKADESGRSGGSSGEGGGAADAVDPELVVDGADTTWDVELADGAVILDESTTAGLIESGDGTLVFEAGSFDGDTVEVGEVMVVPGVGMGQITRIAEAGGHVTVTTSETDLSKVIENGTMAWEAPLDFSSAFVPGETSGGLEIQPLAAQRPGADASGGGPLRWSVDGRCRGHPPRGHRPSRRRGQGSDEVDLRR